MDSLYTAIAQMFPTMNTYLMAGALVFARLIGFLRFCPIFNRKDIPALVKIPLALIVTIFIVPFLSPEKVMTHCDSFALSLLLNIVTGAVIGYMAQLITIAVDSGAEMINMQMGLQAATALDPTTSAQVSLLTKIFSLLGIILFIHVGGIYWLFKALVRSFEIFPLYSSILPIAHLAKMDLLIKVSSNTLYMGVQIAAPVLLATLAQDIILGVISRTAPQVNVFTLSFLFKPVIGAAILIWILPMLMNVIEDYFLSFANII